MSDLNKPQLIGGIDSAGNLVPVKVGSDGSISGTGGTNGTGSGGDASAANQQTEIEKLTSLDEKATNDPATGSKQDDINNSLNNLNGIFDGIIGNFNDEDAYSPIGSYPSAQPNATFISLIRGIFNSTNKIVRNEVFYNASATQANAYLNWGYGFFQNAGTSLNLERYSCFAVNVSSFGSNTFFQGSINVELRNINDGLITQPEIIKLGENKKVASITETGTYIVSLSGSSVSLKTSSDFIGNVQCNLKPIENNLFVNYQLATCCGTEITGTTLPAVGKGILGWLSNIAKLISDRLPSIGTKTAAQSIPVTLSSDGAFSTNFGATTDTAATTDTGTFSFLAFVKRLLSVKLPSTLINDRFKTQTVLDSTTITGSANTLDALVIPLTDCSNYSFISLQLTGTWSGLVTFEFSNTGLGNDWIGGVLSNLNSTATPNTITGLNSIYYGNKQGKFFRARLSTYSSGIVTGTLSLSTSPTTLGFPVTTISGTPNINLATVNNATPDIASQTTLSSVNNKIPTLGQALSAASMPVVLPAAQITTLTPPTTITANIGTTGSLATSALQTSLLNKLMPAGISSNLYTSLGTSVSAVIKSSAGNVYAIYCINANTTIRFLQLFNTTSIPSASAVPFISFPVPPSNGLLLLGQDVLGGEGINLTNGITFALSTTLLSYTAASASDAEIIIRYA